MRVFVARNDGKTLTDYFKMLESCCIDYDYGLKVDDVNLYDGLIIPGGIDIDPFFYHQDRDKTVVQTDKSFDEKQFQLLNLFYQNNKKVLGICRGQQLINVFFKGYKGNTFRVQFTDYVQKVCCASCKSGIGLNNNSVSLSYEIEH